MYYGERLNSVTHIVGAVLAVAGTAVVVTLASLQRDAWSIVAFSIYGAMLVLLYVSSALYHSLRGRGKTIFRIFDHSAIYLLIAGTYAPLTLVALRGTAGWWLFGTVWTLAVAGVVKEALFPGRMRALAITLYVVMGWLVVVAFVPLVRALEPPALVWLVAGGVVYTAGIGFYALSRRIRHAHGIWHLFVIGGSVCHYISLLYVAVPSSVL